MKFSYCGRCVSWRPLHVVACANAWRLKLSLLLLAAAQGATIPSPAPPAEADLLLGASQAVRAATVEGIENLLDQPRRYRFACEISEATGSPRRCVLASQLAESITWQAFFDRAATTGDHDTLERRALERAQSMRLRRMPDRQHLRLVLIDVVLSRHDALPPLAPAQSIAAADLTFESTKGAVAASHLYPEPALREDLWADVQVTCRVTPAHSLLCRDARIVARADDESRHDRAFIISTYQFTSMQKVAPLTRDGRDVRGKDFVWTVRWRPSSD